MSNIEKSLASVTAELKGIKSILSAMWHSRYNDGTTDRVSPEFLADEYISTEECAKRLGVSDQTIRNWILQGKKKDAKKRIRGWTQGIHYITIPMGSRKNVVRIPWNQLILTYYKGEEANLRTFDSVDGPVIYDDVDRSHWDNVPLSKNKENE